MKVKTYSFGDIKKGMELIKEQYGPDTIIMGIKENNLSGHGWSKKACEISIAVEDEPAMAPEDYLIELRRGTEAVWQHTTGYLTDRLVSMEAEMIRDRMKTYPLTLKMFFLKMEKNGLDSRLALEIVSEVYAQIGQLADNSSKAAFFLKEAISRRIATADISDMEGPFVVLGPTGGGKTETVKKMAKMFADRGRPAEIIAFDPAKRSSYDELLGFSEDTGIPFQFTTTVEDLQAKVSEASAHTIVDVTGQMSLQRAAVLALGDYRKIIVLPAGMRDDRMERYLQEYKDGNPAGIVFSKLDEEEQLGNICGTMFRLGRPVCFLTRGTGYDDVSIVDKEVLVRMLIEGVL